MDYDLWDDSRLRFQVQSGPVRASSSSPEDCKVNKVHAAVCVGVGVMLLGIGFVLEGLKQFSAVWLGFSMILGPFAPMSFTGGDCRVGVGDPVPPEIAKELILQEDVGHRSQHRNYYKRRQVEECEPDTKGLLADDAEDEKGSGSAGKDGKSDSTDVFGSKVGNGTGEDDWSLQEIEMLKKLLLKHPRGTLKRWEVISEALGGAHGPESIVKMVKNLGEKKRGDGDSYLTFLNQRKSATDIASPLSQRWESDSTNEMINAKVVGKSDEDSGKAKRSEWTDADDKSLLSALKAFPKETPLRWDKIAAAIPGKSKGQCFKRFAALREKFRNSKVETGYSFED